MEVETQLRVPVASVRPDPMQPRTYFKPAALKSLAESIKQVGQRQPIEVRRLPKGADVPYEIIDGERRWRACQLAGMKTIRVYITEGAMTHQQQHHVSLVSNFLREGHTHIEISNALQYQVDHDRTVEELADSLGKSSSWVYQYLALQKLSSQLKERMHPDTKERLLLRFTVAVVLTALPAGRQWDVYQQLLKVPVSGQAKRARELVEKLTGVVRMGAPVQVKKHLDRFVARLSTDMERILDLKQSEFRNSLQQLPAPELKKFRTSLAQCIEHLQFLSAAVDRERKAA